MAWGDYVILPQYSGFGTNSLLSKYTFWNDGLALGYNTSNRDSYWLACDGYFVKAAYIGTGTGYYSVLCASKQGASTSPGFRVGGYDERLDIGGNEYSYGPWWIAADNRYVGNDTFYHTGKMSQISYVYLKPGVPVYPTVEAALAAMDDGVWKEPVASDSLIKYATVKFDFPVEGLPLSDTVVSATVDNGEVVAGKITWRKDALVYNGLATAGDRYTATFTLTSSTAKFSKGIGRYIVTINTAEKTDVYVKSVAAQFPTADLGIISVGVNFSAVGNTDPYYGDPDIESDPIEEPALPTLSAVDTGFLTLYNPTLSEVQNLATYMWNVDPTTIEFWKKLVADPMDLILGFSLLPCAIPDGGSKSVVVGAVDTGVTMTKAASQFVRIDCGSIIINEAYGNYLDYEPYTKCELYLPYCGTHPISIDDIMGKTIQITYHVDILSGACVAYVIINGVVYYIFAGNCAVSLPVTSAQFSQLLRSTIDSVADLGIFMATGSPVAAMNALTGAAESTIQKISPNIKRSGNIGSMAGQLANQVPYFIFTRPRMSVANNQNAYQGYPTNQTYQLGSLNGFTQVQSIHLSGVPCTDEEMDEIYDLLNKGVII